MNDPLHLDSQLCFALYRASRAVIRAYGPLLQPLDLTYPQYLTMLVLWEHKELAVKDIGAHLSLDSATLTPLLKKLEDSGLISRTRDKNDERKVQVSLTAMGSQLRKKAKGIPTGLACRLGADTSDPAAIKRIVALRKELLGIANLLEEK
jgi:MarR family transcriptional regulator, organic hydroperoxide resistance regulator